MSGSLFSFTHVNKLADLLLFCFSSSPGFLVFYLTAFLLIIDPSTRLIHVMQWLMMRAFIPFYLQHPY